MITLADVKKCTGCAACEQICSIGAITMKQDKEGFRFPHIDENKCISCKKCMGVCPVENPFSSTNPLAVYAARTKDEAIVEKSSSGGIFGALAGKVIAFGGVVFGAGYDSTFNVVHKSAQTANELLPLMGSKYVQSDVKNSFKEVKKYLDEGRQVLFTGTSCQCAGLRGFLRKDYENLLLVDFVCHGVPSPELFRNYLNYMKSKDKIVNVCFRDKATDKKKGLCIRIDYENADAYRVPFTSDPYMLAFLQNISLRRSCYNCNFRNFTSSSDVTIGDFWGIDKTDSILKDKEGISLCILNTEKGKVFFEKIADNVDYDLRSLDEALKENKPLVSSVRYNPVRDKYLKDMRKLNIKKLRDKYCNNSFSAKLRRLIARI